MKNILVITVCLMLSACIYRQHSNERHQGTRIDPQQVAAVELGKTDKQWVLTHFGIPERIQVDKDGLEVFEYVSDQTQASEKSFIFLFKINSEKDIAHQVTRVVMRNAIVEAVTTRSE